VHTATVISGYRLPGNIEARSQAMLAERGNRHLIQLQKDSQALVIDDMSGGSGI